MRIVIVTKDYTDYAREVTDWLRDFKQVTGHDIETLDPETKEGESFARTYDIVEYPTIIAISDSGQLQQLWRGTPLPQINEVSYFFTHS